MKYIIGNYDTIWSWIFRGMITIAVLSCSHQENDVDNTLYTSDLEDNYITKPDITISKKNVVSLKATSDHLIKNDKEDGQLIGNVKADFFDDDGFHKSILFSDSAKINETNNNFKAIGNVVVISDSGFTLRTDEISWDNNYQMVISNDSVMFTTENKDTLYGVGFESDMDLTNYKILKPTGVTYRVIE